VSCERGRQTDRQKTESGRFDGQSRTHRSVTQVSGARAEATVASSLTVWDPTVAIHRSVSGGNFDARVDRTGARERISSVRAAVAGVAVDGVGRLDARQDQEHDHRRTQHTSS